MFVRLEKGSFVTFRIFVSALIATVLEFTKIPLVDEVGSLVGSGRSIG